MNEIEIDDWEDFKVKISENFGDKYGYVFRGHGDQDWKLESTLTRLVSRVSKDISSNFIEKEQLKNFQMSIRSLRGKNPSPLDGNELWSLGQHYGLCTPLLDWTYSPYIAAYFAFENADCCASDKRSIFALNKIELLSDRKFIENNGLDFIEPIQDDNNRIVAQAGLFTKIPVKYDLETWLSEKGLDKYLLKFNIENCLRLDAINDLRLMNIVGSTIYPDLHGAAVTCNMRVESMSENYEFKKNMLKTYETIISNKAQ